jgi:REP element-mobilizing transposase RayT
MPRFRISTHHHREFTDGKHRFEHWYRDKTVYFITARCRDRFPAFKSEDAKAVFWDRFHHYSREFGFVPWITSLLPNHYHTLGYLRVGENLGVMMQRLHGSVAKLVNDVLPERRVPFWREGHRNDYFDGCLRDVLQCRRAYRYTLKQSVRHGLARDYRNYPHTQVAIDVEIGIRRAVELKAFLSEVPYARYERRKA